jgi:hypothetical protein
MIEKNEPDYKMLFESSMDILGVLLDKLSPTEFSPTDIEYINAYYSGVNLRKWKRTQDIKTKGFAV